MSSPSDYIYICTCASAEGNEDPTKPLHLASLDGSSAYLYCRSTGQHDELEVTLDAACKGRQQA